MRTGKRALASHKVFRFVEGIGTKKQIRPLIGKSDKFSGFFRLGKKVLGLKKPAALYMINSSNPLARGLLVRPSPDSLKLLKLELNEPDFRKTASIEYEIKEEFRKRPYENRGIATRLAHLLIDAAKQLGYERLIANINNSNKASIRVIEKSGFRNIKNTTLWYKDI
ncbi:MAG: GNAT family N-acetyltransferase [Candidatus Diapherotrites archaeon]|nr:GNAT family N-acetyltransferase [Candidatus Diapherotrites archaeon]